MLFLRITGGMGNQMFQYIFGKSIEKKYGRKLVLDLTWYNISSSHRYRELEGHESYRLSAFGIEPELMSDSGSGFFNSKPGKLVNLIQFQLIDWGFRPIWPAYFQGYWLGEDFFQNIRDEVADIFTLPPLQNEDALRYQSQMESGPPAVSMHIRRGDYKNHKHLQVCNPDYYKASLAHLDKTLGDYCAFVFSDDIGYCQEMLAGRDNIVFIENAGSDVDEFQLMTHCQHHVISNSTFSWWSAWLAEDRAKDGRMVLAPNRWFNDQGTSQAAKRQDTNRIIPERWIKVQF